MGDANALPSQTGVLIVGAGPVGLTASALLSQAGIENTVIERRSETQRAPAAHVLRPRPMEVFARIGVAEAIERAKPALALDAITWCGTLAGPDVGHLDLRRGLAPGRDVWTNCPQNVLEPILLERAQRAPEARVVQGVECVAVEQEGDAVHARVRWVDAPNDEGRIVTARWLMACDGAGSAVRRMCDIPMEGPGPQGRFFMVHFEADLRPMLTGRSGPLYWIVHPAAPGTLIVHDPAKSHVFMTLRTGADGEAEGLPARLRAALGSDVAFRIRAVDSWSPHVQVAQRYRRGRVFLAGDAAHRFPPTGGLGLNTGVLDADWLVHRLAQVEAGTAPAGALDDYERHCRPVAARNAEDSFGNLKRLGEVGAALGPVGDLAALHARLAALSAAERRALDTAIERQRSHFVSDGAVPPDPRTAA